MSGMFHCKTVSQFKAYQWVKKNFETDLLEIELVDNQAIKIKDMNHETANIQYKNNKILIEYSNNKKQTIIIPDTLSR